MVIGTIGFFVLALFAASFNNPWAALVFLAISYGLFAAISFGYYHA